MKYLFLALISFLAVDLTAQTTGKYKGKEIVIKDDGTWMYKNQMECNFNGKPIIVNANGTWKFSDDNRSTKPNTKPNKNNGSNTTSNTGNNGGGNTNTGNTNTPPEPEPEEIGYSKDENGEFSSRLITVIDKVDPTSGLGFGFKLLRLDEKIKWEITVIGRDKCTVKKSYIDIDFNDGTKMSFVNREDDNCKYLTAATMRLTNEREYKKYGQLSKVAIKGMKVKTKNSEVAFELTDAQATNVMDLFKSVYEVKE